MILSIRGALLREIVATAARSSGPGGQNVNKVSSKVILEWNVSSTEVFDLKERVLIIEAARKLGFLTKSGKIIIIDQASRSQSINKKNAYSRLFALITKALIPVKKRTSTKVPKRSKDKRISDKKKRGEKLKTRRSNLDD